ncbi:MAG: restriction endonuclease subunit S, partial [Bacteroidaceae bacterium]|nr:restriction endonuclease subunit S [Bacteroidaceae bacterium]
MEPKIRLKGFRGEWKTSVIGEIATFSKGRGYSKSDLRPEGNPIVLYGRLYTNYSSVIDSVDTFASLQNGSVLSKGNEVIVPGSGETPEDIAVASAVEQKGVIFGGDLNVVTFDQEIIVPAFAAMSITNSKTHYELSGYAQGKTVVHLHNGSISKGHLSYPSIDEQNAIVSYVSSIDSLIQSTTKKIESLKQVKAASLQSMFPQEGETTPRVRFKGFEGEWETNSLNTFLTPSNLKNRDCKFTKEDVLSVSGEFGVVNQIAFQGRSFAGVSVANYGIVEHKDIVYTKSPLKTNPYGIIKTNEGEAGIVSTLYAVYKCTNETNPTFVQYYFDLDSRL